LKRGWLIDKDGSSPLPHRAETGSKAESVEDASAEPEENEDPLRALPGVSSGNRADHLALSEGRRSSTSREVACSAVIVGDWPKSKAGGARAH
jgi:hypothetical protein